MPESVKNAGYQLQAAGGQNASTNAHVDIHLIKSFFRKPLQPKKMATVQFAGSAMY
jgi:hypothetical protein